MKTAVKKIVSTVLSAAMLCSVSFVLPDKAVKQADAETIGGVECELATGQLISDSNDKIYLFNDGKPSHQVEEYYQKAVNNGYTGSMHNFIEQVTADDPNYPNPDYQASYFAGAAQNGYIGIDMGAGNEKPLREIDFFPRCDEGYGLPRMTNVNFEGSTDAQNWDIIYTQSARPVAGWNKISYSSFNENTRDNLYRYYRIVNTAGPLNVAEVEFWVKSDLPPSEDLVTRDFYVSPNGNAVMPDKFDYTDGMADDGFVEDFNNAGTQDNPFGSVADAVKAIAAINLTSHKMTEDITVHVAEGTYYTYDPITLGKDTSGTNNHKIRFVSENENFTEEVIGGARFYGGEIVPNSSFKTLRNSDSPYINDIPDEYRDSIYVAQLDTDKGAFYTLYEKGERLETARHPNRNTAYPGARGPYLHLEYRDGWVTYNPDEFDSDMLIYKRNAAGNSLGLDSIMGELQTYIWADSGDHAWNAGTGQITELDIADSKFRQNAGGGGSANTNEGTPNRFFFENNLGLLDAEGEWFYDKEDGRLYVYPKNDINDTQIVVPRAERLVLVSNAENLEFDGFSFACTDARVPFYSTWDPASVGQFNAAFEFKNSNSISIKNCNIRQIGMNGIYLDGTDNSDITGCLIENIGLSGITVMGDNNSVQSCRIKNPCQLNPNYKGISMENSRRSSVQNCEISGSSRYAITFSGYKRHNQEDPDYYNEPSMTNNIVMRYIKMTENTQDSGDTAPLYTVDGGHGYHVVDQVISMDNHADPSMLDRSPGGIYDDRDGSETLYSNVLTWDNGFPAYREDPDRSGNRWENCSWLYQWKKNIFAYDNKDAQGNNIDPNVVMDTDGDGNRDSDPEVFKPFDIYIDNTTGKVVTSRDEDFDESAVSEGYSKYNVGVVAVSGVTTSGKRNSLTGYVYDESSATEFDIDKIEMNSIGLDSKFPSQFLYDVDHSVPADSSKILYSAEDPWKLGTEHPWVEQGGTLPAMDEWSLDTLGDKPVKIALKDNAYTRFTTFGDQITWIGDLNGGTVTFYSVEDKYELGEFVNADNEKLIQPTRTENNADGTTSYVFSDLGFGKSHTIKAVVSAGVESYGFEYNENPDAEPDPFECEDFVQPVESNKVQAQIEAEDYIKEESSPSIKIIENPSHAGQCDYASYKDTLIEGIGDKTYITFDVSDVDMSDVTGITVRMSNNYMNDLNSVYIDVYENDANGKLLGTINYTHTVAYDHYKNTSTQIKKTDADKLCLVFRNAQGTGLRMNYLYLLRSPLPSVTQANGEYRVQINVKDYQIRPQYTKAKLVTAIVDDGKIKDMTTSVINEDLISPATPVEIHSKIAASGKLEVFYTDTQQGMYAFTYENGELTPIELSESAVYNSFVNTTDDSVKVTIPSLPESWQDGELSYIRPSEDEVMNIRWEDGEFAKADYVRYATDTKKITFELPQANGKTPYVTRMSTLEGVKATKNGNKITFTALPTEKYIITMAEPSQSDIKIVLNGVPLKTPVGAEMKDGRLLIPMGTVVAATSTYSFVQSLSQNEIDIRGRDFQNSRIQAGNSDYGAAAKYVTKNGSADMLVDSEHFETLMLGRVNTSCDEVTGTYYISYFEDNPWSMTVDPYNKRLQFEEADQITGAAYDHKEDSNVVESTRQGLMFYFKDVKLDDLMTLSLHMTTQTNTARLEVYAVDSFSGSVPAASDKIGEITTTETGNWNTYADFKVDVNGSLSGTKGIVIRIAEVLNGSWYGGNFDYMDLNYKEDDADEPVEPEYEVILYSGNNIVSQGVKTEETTVDSIYISDGLKAKSDIYVAVYNTDGTLKAVRKTDGTSFEAVTVPAGGRIRVFAWTKNMQPVEY